MSERTFGVDLPEGSRRAKLSGELDMESYDELSRILLTSFDGGGDIELDLADVTFVDSSAIRLFAQLHRSTNGNGRLILIRPQPQVSRVLEVAGLADLGIAIERTGDA